MTTITRPLPIEITALSRPIPGPTRTSGFLVPRLLTKTLLRKSRSTLPSPPSILISGAGASPQLLYMHPSERTVALPVRGPLW